MDQDVHDQYSLGLYHGCETDVKLIDEMPAVDAVPVVHGRWGTIERDEVKSEIVVECSECGAVFASTIFTFALNYNYCPTCAAKMDGEEK